MALETLEGHQRAIMGSMTVEVRAIYFFNKNDGEIAILGSTYNYCWFNLIDCAYFWRVADSNFDWPPHLHIWEISYNFAKWDFIEKTFFYFWPIQSFIKLWIDYSFSFYFRRFKQQTIKVMHKIANDKSWNTDGRNW